MSYPCQNQRCKVQRSSHFFCLATKATRRICPLNATSATEFAILLARMHSFILQALETFEHLELASDTDSQLPEDVPQRVADD